MVSIDIDTRDGRREALRRMLTIREFEETIGDLFADGELPGFVHLYIGEEATGVGACAALGDEDYLTSTHRGHGHCIAKGLDPRYMMAELYGRVEGYGGGKGGSMHIADFDANMLGANGIVGAGPPLATGAALTQELEGADRVALAFLGDGAVAQGQVHEAINLAATWDLPAVYVVENNQYGEATPVEEQHNVEDLSDAATAYGIPGTTVDGMDVEAVFDAVREARERALAGEGPSMVEAVTYRYRPHSEGFFSDRPEEEEQRWRERDPIQRFVSELRGRGELADDDLDAMRAAVEETIAEAVAFAEDATEPEPEAAYDDVFDGPTADVDYHRGRLGGE